MGVVELAGGDTVDMRLTVSEKAQVPDAERGQFAAGDRHRIRESLKDVLLSFLGHELKTPLMSIHHIGDYLLQTRGGELPLVVNEGLRLIIEHSQEQMQLVDNLLKLNTLLEGKLELKHQSIPLPLLVEELVKGMHPLLEKMGVSAHVDSATDLPLVSGDAGQVYHVLSLLSAHVIRRAAPGGTFSIRLAEEADRQVTIILLAAHPAEPGEARRHPRVRAAVEMLPRMRPIIYPEQGRVVELCLRLARDLVKLHGSTLEDIDERDGEYGFRFRLPAAQ